MVAKCFFYLKTDCILSKETKAIVYCNLPLTKENSLSKSRNMLIQIFTTLCGTFNKEFWSELIQSAVLWYRFPVLQILCC